MPNFMRLFCGLFACLLAGCSREEIRVYRIPKEAHDHAHVHDHAPTAVPPTLTWKTPTGWQEQPASQFRVASFKITGPDGKQADVSVIPLPGGAGGDLGNVNRWRGQVGLEPITAEELVKLAEPVSMPGPPTSLYDLAGENMRILAAMQVRDSTTWFYKMTGDTALVGEQKAAFLEFLKSLDFVSSTAPASNPVPTWVVPDGWQKADAGQFLVAKYVITGDGKSQAAVNVSSSAGDGGGLTANVNRWRQQLGLSELAGDELSSATKVIETAAGRGMVVEMVGGSAALVAVIVPQGAQTWFFKLMGDPRVVTVQREAFIKFVREAKF